MVYHINPETGNSNICKASKNPCPYQALGDDHYSTAEEARSAFEEKMKNPMSRAAELSIRRIELYEHIILESLKENADRLSLYKLVDRRTALENAIERLSNSKDTAPKTGVIEAELTSLSFTGDEPRVGFQNRFETIYEKQNELLTQFKDASIAWAKTLSSKEISALTEYSKGYHELVEKDNPAHEHIASALNKLVKFKKPVKVYSGVNEYTQAKLTPQLNNKTIKIDRPISTTLNPGQGNAFSHYKNSMMLEIEIDEGAPMHATTVHPHELEIMLPEGEYEVVEKKTGLSYSYGKNGIEYETTLILKRVKNS